MKTFIRIFVCLGVSNLAWAGTSAAIEPLHSGKSMNQVIQALGEPTHKSTPVGDPPITRWEYEQQTVYFEHDRVIHTVLHNKSH